MKKPYLIPSLETMKLQTAEPLTASAEEALSGPLDFDESVREW